MSRPRVLVLTKTTAVGGAERQLMNALPHLDRDAFDYRFAALDGGGPLERACRATGLPFARLPGRGVLDPRRALRLRRRLAAERVDVLHAHLPLVGALARLAAWGLPTRVVYTEHNTPAGYRWTTHWLNAATSPWQTALVAVSEEVRRRSPGAGGDVVAVVPNGVDLARLEREAAAGPEAPPPAPEGALRVVVPATLARRKGQDVLLHALAQPALATHALVVWLAGDGPAEEALRRQARRSGLADRVAFLGRRGDVPALLRAADLVVLPSRTEGHPLALLEAMALGRPVLATRVGGVPEVVEGGRTGWLVPPERPEALATALARLAADPGLRGRLGLAAVREARARFDVRRSVSGVEAVYHRVLALASPPVPLPSVPIIQEEDDHAGDGTQDTKHEKGAGAGARTLRERLRGDRGRGGRRLEELRQDP